MMRKQCEPGFYTVLSNRKCKVLCEALRALVGAVIASSNAVLAEFI